jgi:hypothetical protein
VRRVVTYLEQVGEEIPGYLTTSSRATNDLPVDTERLDVLSAPERTERCGRPLDVSEQQRHRPRRLLRHDQGLSRLRPQTPRLLPHPPNCSAWAQAFRKRNECRRVPPQDLILPINPL